MTRLAITGCSGRMGKTLIAAIEETEGVELTAAIERPGMSIIGADAFELAGVRRRGIVVVDEGDLVDLDTFLATTGIDFSQMGD